MTHLTSGSASSRVLIIGIDGGTWRVLGPAIEQGCMPFLKHLIDTGASGTLLSTIPALTPPAWASFQTGRNPGATGVFCFTSFDRASRKPGFVSAQLLHDTIWEQASAAGKRVVVLNVPLTWPPRPVNGAMVTGLLTPSMESDFTWPPELKEELLKVVPGYQIFKAENMTGVPPHKDVEGFVRRMADAAASRAKAAEYLIFTRNPDLCMVHFQTSDIIQHTLWCYLDPADPLYDENKHRYILEHFYGALDQAIKDTCDAFARAGDENVTNFVISDHGFELHKKRFNLGTWLHQQGLLVRDRKVEKPLLRKRISRALKIGKLLRLFVSNESVEKLETAFRVAPQAVDWETSPTYVAGYGSEAGIYLLQDDVPHRALAIARITKGLKALKDPFTSAPVIQAVYRKEELYHGPQMHLMPDLIVVPVAGYTCTGYCFPGRPLVEDVSPDIDYHLGKHHSEGIIIANGPAIVEEMAVRASLVDAAPTVLYALGVDIAADCDGSVITDLFTSDFRSARGLPRIRNDVTTRSEEPAASAYSAQDEQEIQKKLRDLGYM